MLVCLSLWVVAASAASLICCWQRTCVLCSWKQLVLRAAWLCTSLPEQRSRHQVRLSQRLSASQQREGLRRYAAFLLTYHYNWRTWLRRRVNINKLWSWTNTHKRYLLTYCRWLKGASLPSRLRVSIDTELVNQSDDILCWFCCCCPSVLMMVMMIMMLEYLLT